MEKKFVDHLANIPIVSISAHSRVVSDVARGGAKLGPGGAMAPSLDELAPPLVRPAHGLVWGPEGPKLVFIYPSPTTLAPPEICLAPPGPTAQNTLAPPLDVANFFDSETHSRGSLFDFSIGRTQLTDHFIKRGKDSQIKLQMIFERSV